MDKKQTHFFLGLAGGMALVVAAIFLTAFSVPNAGVSVNLDQSQAYIRGGGPSLILTHPNGGETFYKGQNYDITWSYNFVDDPNSPYTNSYYLGNSNIYLEGFYPNGGAMPSQTIAYNIQTTNKIFEWTVPDGPEVPAGAHYFIRIELTDNSSIGDWSDNAFSIAGSTVTPSPTRTPYPSVSVLPSPTTPPLVLVWPNGGEKLYAGKTYNIIWKISKDVPGRSVTLNLSRANHQLSYTLNLPDHPLLTNGSGSYQFAWQVPSWVESGDDYIVTVQVDNSGGVQQYFDSSDSPFSIVRRCALVQSWLGFCR